MKYLENTPVTPLIKEIEKLSNGKLFIEIDDDDDVIFITFKTRFGRDAVRRDKEQLKTDDDWVKMLKTLAKEYLTVVIPQIQVTQKEIDEILENFTATSLINKNKIPLNEKLSIELDDSDDVIFITFKTMFGGSVLSCDKEQIKTDEQWTRMIKTVTQMFLTQQLPQILITQNEIDEMLSIL